MRLVLFAFFCLASSFSFGSDLLQEMSLEEKVGQILMVHFQGESVNEKAKALVQEVKVGSIIYYNWSNGLISASQVENLSVGLQELAKQNRTSLPLLIATDQEGGVVTRLSSGFTIFPGNRALGETFDLDLAKLSALAMGKELAAVGVNMNLAPVVDVNSNPYNPIIGLRSFGETPEGVTLCAEKVIEGYREAKVIPTIKHFPGHGDTSVDSHEDLPILHKSIEELEKVELFPFTQLAKRAPVIMTAHLLVPALDRDNCSTFSEKTLSYLRDKIGFEGIIITDSLVMEGAIKKCGTVEKAAMQALNAGADILLLGGMDLNNENRSELTVDDIKRIQNFLVKAVQEKKIPEKRLDEAVQRVLTLKKEYIASKGEKGKGKKAINALEHREIAKKIAFKSLKSEQKTEGSISHLQEKKILVIAPEIVKENMEKTSLLQLGKITKVLYFSPHPSQAEIAHIEEDVKRADLLILCSYNAWKNPLEISLLQTLLDREKPAVFIAMRDPLDTKFFSKADLLFTPFSPTAVSIEAICDQLKKLR